MINIGIIGKGFVGDSVSFGFDHPEVNQTIVDPKYTNTTIKDLVSQKPVVVFICLPTPTMDDGEVDITALSNVINELHENQYDGIVVIKSTITPNAIARLTCNNSLRIIHNPEFLTERFAHYDFINPMIQVFGGDEDDCAEVDNLYSKYSKVNVKENCIFKTDIITASLVKYTFNSFYATKVTFMNEIHNLHKNSGAESSWNKFTHIIGSDFRVGNQHLSVPGPDGKVGFGGKCFPKDTTAFLKYATSINSNLTILETAVNTNNKIRK